MVKKNPSNLQRVKAGDAFAKQLGHLDVAVVVHPASGPVSVTSANCVGLLPQRTASGCLELRLLDPPQVKSVAEAMEAGCP